MKRLPEKGLPNIAKKSLEEEKKTTKKPKGTIEFKFFFTNSKLNIFFNFTRLLREQEESVNITGMNMSESLRRQRSKEAKELIGHSTSQARALFEQNSAQGQMSNR